MPRSRLLILLILVLPSCASSNPTTVTTPSRQPSVAPSGDPTETVRQYLDATTAADLDKAAALVADDSLVFESGGNEGTWSHYRDHHLAPELDAFEKFEIRPGELRTKLSRDGTLAVVSLPMEYDIALKDGRAIQSIGTATFSLQYVEDQYLIDHIHWSSRRRPGAAAPKPDPAATERAAYERAKPVLEEHCGACHTKGGAKAKAKILKHFDMSTYPFGGHHADQIGETVRASLGATKAKATMPKGSPGSLSGEDLEIILAWTVAFAEAGKAGVHAKANGDDGHSHAH